MTNVTEEQVLAALGQVMLPESGKDIVTLDMIRGLKVEGDTLEFSVILPPAAEAIKDKLEDDIVMALRPVPGLRDVSVRFESTAPAGGQQMNKMKLDIKNVIAVASGKGGVGKSTISTNLAISLALDGAKVGLLDADIYGPNVPIMMGINERPKGHGQRITPLEAHGVKLMSMGFLISPTDPVIWRGPMVHNALRQFLQDVDWGGLDYLVIDLPPGTGDISLSLSQSLGLRGAVIVTTPQKVALSDVVRGVEMFKQLNVPILGVVENMSYFEAPDTGKRYDIFGTGGGAKMAEEVGVEFLGEVPLEPQVRIGGDEGTPIVVRDPESGAAKAIRAVANKVNMKIAGRKLVHDTRISKDGPKLTILS
jgi:ATP-binding protein involved in chromosome partitioning